MTQMSRSFSRKVSSVAIAAALGLFAVSGIAVMAPAAYAAEGDGGHHQGDHHAVSKETVQNIYNTVKAAIAAARASGDTDSAGVAAALAQALALAPPGTTAQVTALVIADATGQDVAPDAIGSGLATAAVSVGATDPDAAAAIATVAAKTSSPTTPGTIAAAFVSTATTLNATALVSVVNSTSSGGGTGGTGGGGGGNGNTGSNTSSGAGGSGSGTGCSSISPTSCNS